MSETRARRGERVGASDPPARNKDVVFFFCLDAARVSAPLNSLA